MMASQPSLMYNNTLTLALRHHLNLYSDGNIDPPYCSPLPT